MTSSAGVPRRAAIIGPTPPAPIPLFARLHTPSSLPAREAERPRILIVRLSALGDIVFATALLEGLRARWPGAHIAWMLQSGLAGILENDPRLDELIRLPADVLRSPAALWRLRGELAQRRFDWVIDAQGLAKSRLFAWLTPGARRMGFDSKEPLGFVLDQRIDKGGDVRDLASEYRYLSQRLTGQVAPPPRLRVSESARVAAVAALTEQGLSPGFIALCPFTTRPQKHWMDDYWPQLAGQLDRPCAIFGGPADIAAAQRLCDAASVPVINLAGKTRLNQLAAWLEQASLVIGVDTGLTHIGSAVRRPVVALFGSTCPYTQGADSPLRVLYDALPCSPCKRHPTCDGRYDCLRGITPARVAAAAHQLLGSA